MKILIAIPSKNRAAIFRKNAMAWVWNVGCDWKVFLEPQDVERYALPDRDVVVLPKNNGGYGYAKVCIKEYALANGYGAILKIDDDIAGWTDFRARLKPTESGHMLHTVLNQMEEAFEEHPLVAGFSFPYSFQMFEKYDFNKSKRVQTAYLFRTEEFYADERVSNFDDFAMSINAIVHNKVIFMCGLTGIVLGVKVGGGSGGQQEFDRLVQSEKEAEVLRELYPPLTFRRVQKRWGIEPNLQSVKVGLYL